MEKLAIIISILLGIALSSTGCEWMGRMTAKAEKGIQSGTQKMEDGIEKMEKKFEKGRENADKDD